MKEGLSLQGKGRWGERFGWRRETGLFMGMSVDREGMKLSEEGHQDGQPLGRLERMILNTDEGGVRSALDASGE